MRRVEGMQAANSDLRMHPCQPSLLGLSLSPNTPPALVNSLPPTSRLVRRLLVQPSQCQSARSSLRHRAQRRCRPSDRTRNRLLPLPVLPRRRSRRFRQRVRVRLDLRSDPSRSTIASSRNRSLRPFLWSPPTHSIPSLLFRQRPQRSFLSRPLCRRTRPLSGLLRSPSRQSLRRSLLKFSLKRSNPSRLSSLHRFRSSPFTTIRPR